MSHKIPTSLSKDWSMSANLGILQEFLDQVFALEGKTWLSVKCKEQDSQQAGLMTKDGLWTSAFRKPLFQLWEKGLQRPVCAQKIWQVSFLT